ncbi:hypothetical protein OF83DRAFT_1171153 [Amylostereum chailletii]|nr:hypothetical protein OF83DRAFT_1171153 [Amylostereum chailletii]
MSIEHPATRTGEGVAKKNVSPWIPVTLLAVTTAALAVPLVLLRRQRSGATSLSHAADRASPPPRRIGRAVDSVTAQTSTPTPVTGPPPPRRPSRASVVASPAIVASPIIPFERTIPKASPSEANAGAEDADAFNAPLYTLKAFSLATFCVLFTGGVGVWGVKTSLGVKDTQEFGALMRAFMLSKMPFLSSRIYRTPSSSALPPAFPLPVSLPFQAAPVDHEYMEEDALRTWTWAAAQERLSAAYEQGGMGLWAEVALREMEIEAELLRRRRAVEEGAAGPGVS